MDVDAKTIHDVTGPEVDPTEHAWSDGVFLYVVSDGELFRARKGNYEMTPVGVAGGIDFIAARPQGDAMILGHSDGPTVYRFDVDTQRVTKTYFE